MGVDDLPAMMRQRGAEVCPGRQPPALPDSPRLVSDREAASGVGLFQQGACLPCHHLHFIPKGQAVTREGPCLCSPYSEWPLFFPPPKAKDTPRRVPTADVASASPLCLPWATASSMQEADLPVKRLRERERESTHMHTRWSQTLPASFPTTPGTLTSNPISCDLLLNKPVFAGLSLLPPTSAFLYPFSPGSPPHPPHPPAIPLSYDLYLLSSPTQSTPCLF